MSLINDALKRAKQSQAPQTPPPEAHLHFRPVETEAVIRRGFGLLLPVTLALIALLGLFFVWELAHKPGATSPQPELVVRAVSLPPAPALPVQPPPPIVSEAAPATPATSQAPPAASTPDPAETAPATPPEVTTVADDPPAPPKPAPLRLQGIVFDPARPSAMISGKTLFVGDKVGEFRVGAISQDSATLFKDGQTNVLELAH
jgi:hypothetical protein